MKRTLFLVLLCVFLVGCSQQKQEVSGEEKIPQEKQNEVAAEENGYIKNEDGELVEIHLSENDKAKVPDGWGVVAKKYDPYSGEWLNVYQQPLTPNIFKEKFNKISTKAIGEDNFLIKEITIQEGEVNNVFQLKFNEKIIINGVLNDKNEITSVVAFLEEDGGPETGPYNLEIQKALIKILSPTVKEDELFPLIEKLKYLSSYSELMNEIGNSYSEELGNVKYYTDYKITPDSTVLCIFGIEKFDFL